MGRSQWHTKKRHWQGPNPTTQQLCQSLHIIYLPNRNNLTFSYVNLQTSHNLKTKKQQSNMKDLLHLCITKQNSIIRKQQVGNAFPSTPPTFRLKATN